MLNTKTIAVSFSFADYPVPLVISTFEIDRDARDCEIENEARRLILDKINYSCEEIIDEILHSEQA